MGEQQEANEKPLEERMKEDETTPGKLGSILAGYGVPLLGAVAGYLVTQGIGGVSFGMAASSAGIAYHRKGGKGATNLEFRGYQIGFVLGAVICVMRLFHNPEKV